jgi:hypothetical protein
MPFSADPINLTVFRGRAEGVEIGAKHQNGLMDI